jgi:HlyD family secretion protein
MERKPAFKDMDYLSSELNKLKIDKSKRADAPRRRSLKFVILLLVLLTLGIGTVVYRRATAAIEVEVIKPRSDDSSQSAVLVATGYVVAHHKIQVGSKIAGRVGWIGVEKGDRVRRDQVVVRLEDREYRAQFDQARAAYEAAQARLQEFQTGSRPEEIMRAQAEIERAQAQLRIDEAQLRRTEGLVKEGVAPAQTLDEIRGRYDADRATLASLMQTLELTRQGPRIEQVQNARSEATRAQAVMDYARSILDATEIRVPIGGTILERNVEQGEMVTTSFVGDQGAKGFVVTLADLTDVQVELDINQNDFNRIRPDQPCTIVTDAYPDRPYDCRVDEIAPEANRQKATVQVKVKFLQPDEHIRPEMNARVTFFASDASTAVKADTAKLFIVPKRSVLDRETGKAVLIAQNGRAQEQPVTVEKEVGSDVFVSTGLNGGESVIVGEQLEQLKTGDKVQVK